MGVNDALAGSERVSHQSFHSWEQISHKVHIFVLVVRIQVPLEISYAKFICILKFTIVFSTYLHRIVGQMHKPVRQITQIEGLRARAEVAISIEITLHLPIR